MHYVHIDNITIFFITVLLAIYNNYYNLCIIKCLYKNKSIIIIFIMSIQKPLKLYLCNINLILQLSIQYNYSETIF